MGVGVLNWWAGGANPLESLFGGDREAKAGEGAMSPPPTPLDCQAEESKGEFILHLKFSFPFIRPFVPI